MRQCQLLTSDETLDALHTLANGRKQKVILNKDDLSALLTDHHVMYAALRDKGAMPVTPSAKRARARL